MAHKTSVPTIMDTASQLQKRLDRLGLTLLFVATDAEQYGIYILYKLDSLKILYILKSVSNVSIVIEKNIP